MKPAYLAATVICLAAASAVGAQTTPKPVAAPAPAAAVVAPAKPAAVVAAPKPAPVATPVVAPVVSPIFAPAPAPAPVAAPAPRPAPIVVSNGDPVEAWVRKMITHHRAAISMAESMMNSTQDREAARVAKSTYYRELRDIVTLQSWLKRHGKTAQ